MYPRQTKNLYRRYNEFRSHGLNHVKSVYLLQLMYELTPRGFEEYVRRYFYRVCQIEAKVIGGYDDKGIDIIGIYKKKPLFIQCKKWASRHIKKSHILDFWHNVTHSQGYTSNTMAILITTNRVSFDAKQVAKEYNISVRDYKHLLRWAQKYSFQNFEKEIGRYIHEKSYYKTSYFTDDKITVLIEQYVSSRPKQMSLVGD